jgi:hypothetical protein
MTSYDYLYLLDSEKSKVYFLSCFIVGKKILATLGPKLGTKNPKIEHFKANFRLVKIVNVQKS